MAAKLKIGQTLHGLREERNVAGYTKFTCKVVKVGTKYFETDNPRHSHERVLLDEMAIGHCSDRRDMYFIKESLREEFLKRKELESKIYAFFEKHKFIAYHNGLPLTVTQLEAIAKIIHLHV